jgi:N-acetylglucosamine kinase-like BadF-type ATPase
VTDATRMPGVVLGVDAGNTKTHALVVDEHGAVLGFGQAGMGDIYATPTPEDGVAAVFAAADAALAAAGLARADLAGAAFLLAGVDWPDDEALWTDAVDARLPASVPRCILNDGFALLRHLADDGRGVSITAGTGPAVAARGPAGEWTVSWWMRHELGAAGIVRQALDAVVLAEMGLGPATGLRDPLLAAFGADDVDALLRALTERGSRWTRPDVAARAPVVLGLADADPAAGAVLDAQARAFAGYALAALRRTGWAAEAGTATPAILGGRLLAAPDSPLRVRLGTSLRAAVPGIRIVPGHPAPVTGAVLEALAAAGLPLGPARERLAAWDAA